jgi:hypothetical protein
MDSFFGWVFGHHTAPAKLLGPLASAEGLSTQVKQRFVKAHAGHFSPSAWK